MHSALFWELIETTKTQAGGDEQLQEQLLIATLMEHDTEQIVGFECLLCQYLIEADDFGILAAEKIVDGYVTDDSYLYFRCWLVSQGEEVFHNALRNPDTLADVIEARFPEFEMLLYVATEAFEQRTGQSDEDEASPRSIAASRGLSYDSDSVTKGTDWTADQLPARYPKLWARFGG